MKIAIISDIHGNLEAFRAVWEKIKKYPLILNAGDITGYYPDVNPIIETFRINKVRSILGNHDQLLIRGELTESMASWVEKPFKYQLKNISQDNINYLKTFKKNMIIDIDNLKISLFHGSPKNIEEYIYSKSDLGEFNNNTFDFIVLGHTHIPMHFKILKTEIINPGSVGQPRDNDRRSSYAVLDTKTRKVQFERVNYDIERVCKKIRKLRFDSKLIDILRKDEQS